MTVDEDDTEVAEAEAVSVKSVCVLGSVSNTSRDGGRMVDTETADIVEESEDEDDAEVNFFFGDSGGAVTTGGTRRSSGLRLEPEPEFEFVRRPTRSRPRSTMRTTPSLWRSLRASRSRPPT